MLLMPLGLHCTTRPLSSHLHNPSSLYTAQRPLSTQSAQPPRLLPPRPSKLQPRMIAHPHHRGPENPPLSTHQTLDDRLPAHAKPPQHNLTILNIRHPPLLLHASQEIISKLIRGIVRAAIRLAEAQVPRTETEHRRAVRSGQREVRVVFCGEDVEVVGFWQDLLEVCEGSQGVWVVVVAVLRGRDAEHGVDD